MPAISVVILNWNGRELLLTCLASLEKQTFGDWELIVVDNASADGSPELVRERFPRARLVLLDRNYGFCAGNNRGTATAQGRYIVFLNNDIEADPGFLQALFDAIEAHPDVGFCATRMLRFRDRSRVDSCGIGLHIVGKGYQIGAGKINGAQFDEMRYVFGAAGGAALYRRTMLDEIGLFDEDFFSHVEDVDLAWRAQLAGYHCLYVPGAIVYHVGGATSRRIPEQVLYRIQRNITWAYLKNMPTSLLIGLGPLHVLYCCYWLLRAASRGQGGVVLKAKTDAIRARSSIKAKRRTIQNKRKLSTRALLKLMGWHRV
ncbi:MAG: glycosyltransferase family 2 protein [Chloroflexi bacterium]|nr:glycosyltransferase family 2 protein [Chloroflexota bacterium]MBU1750216.1 glycosyltransferase family 2 protein [Chloroflexota bacterium]